MVVLYTPHHLCGSTGTCSSSDCHQTERLKAEKGHADPPHYYNQTRGGEETEDGIYDEVRERTGHIQGLMQPFQDLKLETLERRQYITMEN